MGAPKGHPRYGGRVKGTPNKERQTLNEICQQVGANPFLMLLKTAMESQDPYLAFAALKEVCKYLYPQLKAVEVKATVDNPYADKPVNELESMVKERLLSPKTIDISKVSQ